MKKIFFTAIIAVSLLSCGAKKAEILSTTTNYKISSDQVEPFFDITKFAKDETYGLTSKNPVKVGERSASNQRRYLASLAGPNGEMLSFYRQGSCCPYESENGFGGSAFVDIYEVSYEGAKEPILVYISFYDFEELKIPKGFTRRDL